MSGTHEWDAASLKASSAGRFSKAPTRAHSEHGCNLPRALGQAGLTVLEVLIATVVATVALGILITALGASSDTYMSVSRIARAEEGGRRALDAIVNDLRLADKDMFVITPEFGSHRVDFRVPTGYDDHGGVQWSTTIAIRYEPSTLDANLNSSMDEGMLVRIQDGRRRVLCHYIEQGQFSLERTGDHVAVELGLVIGDGKGRVATRSVRTSVELRNGSVYD